MKSESYGGIFDRYTNTFSCDVAEFSGYNLPVFRKKESLTQVLQVTK